MISQLNEFLKGNKGVLRMASEGDQKLSSFPLHDLPDSLILNIFSFLRIRQRLHLRRVSKTWSKYLYDFSIWQEISLNEEIFLSSLVNRTILKKWLADFGKTMHKLDLSNTMWITDDDVAEAARACGNLRTLNIKGCPKVTDAGISQIAHNCPKLEKVDVFLSNITTRGLREIVCHCPYVKHIRLGSQSNTSKMISSICEHCTRIISLAIYDAVPQTSGINEPAVDDILILRLASRFTMLVRLSFTWCCFVTDESLAALAEHCPALQTLKLRECQQVTDQGLKEVLQKCAKLQNLGLERLYRVTDELAPYKSLSNILSLKIFDTKMTDDGIARMTALCSDLYRLSFGEYSFHPKYIKGSCLPSVASHCKKLRYLHVFCDHIDDEGLYSIGEHLQYLTDLSIGDCSSCEADSVLDVARGCRYLQFLSFKNCDAIGSEEIHQIKELLPYLKTLELPGNTKIAPLGSWYVVANALIYPPYR